MSWGDLAPLEPVTVIGSDRVIMAGISEHSPSAAINTPGLTTQGVKLLLPSAERLDPPMRIVVRGAEMRVLGTQAPPWPDAPAIVTCQRVNPDLPDLVQIVAVTGRELNQATGRYDAIESILWSGDGHVNSGTPDTVEIAEEIAPLDKITLTVPLSAPYRSMLVVRLPDARTPGMAGDDWVMSGEVLDSSASLRQIICYRPGR